MSCLTDLPCSHQSAQSCTDDDDVLGHICTYSRFLDAPAGRLYRVCVVETCCRRVSVAASPSARFLSTGKKRDSAVDGKCNHNDGPADEGRRAWIFPDDEPDEKRA